MLAKGEWAGRTASLIGGGPSLKGFDFSRIPAHHKVIVLNAAFKFLPWADLAFSEDIRFLEKFGSELQDKFNGKVVWHCLKGIDPERGLNVCPRVQIVRELRDDKFWSEDIDSLSFSSNSAVGAINLAEILGVRKLYVLGLDCRAEGIVMENFHSEYPQEWQVNSVQALHFKSDLENWVAPMCEVPIVNVINPAYESALECWPKITHLQYLQGAIE